MTTPMTWQTPEDYERLSAPLQGANARLIAQFARGWAQTACDAGCGTGLVARELRRAGISSVDAFDPSAEMVEMAAVRCGEGVRVSQSTIESFAGRGYSFVASSAVLHWTYPEIHHSIRHLVDLVAEGGLLCYATAGRTGDSERYDAEVDALAARAGIEPAGPAFARRRVSIQEAAEALDQTTLQVHDAFLVERIVEMSARDWVSWLIASGSPWGTQPPERWQRLASEAPAAVEVRTWSAIVLAQNEVS